jgi:hypothetical protein
MCSETNSVMSSGEYISQESLASDSSVAVLSPSVFTVEGKLMRKIFTLEAPNAECVELDAEWAEEKIPFSRGEVE